MTTPAGTFSVCQPTLFGDELRYVTQAVLDSDISGKGSFVHRFEETFARSFRVKHAIAVGNGSIALFIACQALGIGDGDEVIVPTFTMAASAFAVMLTGAKCKWVDCKKDGNINPDYIEAKITHKTKAILPVHIYGVPADMEKICEIAKKHGLKVIEDAAEAHGASVKGRFVGTIGDIGCFSMYANKIATCGEGGVIVTNDDVLESKCRILRDYAQVGVYRHAQPALNGRMSNLNAAIGLAQMEVFQKLVVGRLGVGAYYSMFLAGKDGIKIPEVKPGSVMWMYGVRVRNRDKVMQILADKGIETRPFFVPMHLQPFNGNWDTRCQYPIAETLSEQGLYLPSSSHLSLNEVKYISEELISAVRDAGAS